MLHFLRFVQLLTVVLWVGGLAFFAFVLAPTAFHVLPTPELAGAIVGSTLHTFHVIALTCGLLFLAATAVLFTRSPMRVKGRYEMELLLAAVMLVATIYLQWNILPTMEADRTRAGGDISAVPPDHPARLHFDRLHKRSERVEGAVFFLGLGVVFLMSREQAPAT